MNGRPVDGFVRKAVARTAEDIGPGANDNMEVVELFLLASAVVYMPLEMACLVALQSHRTPQRSQFDRSKQAWPLKHGVEHALKSLVFQKLRQVLPLVFGKARPPTRLTVFVAILVILPDLAEGFSIEVSLFVATLLDDTLGTRVWEVFQYISISRGTGRLTT